MDFSLSRTDEAIGGRGLAGGRSLSQTFDSQWLQWRLGGGVAEVQKTRCKVCEGWRVRKSGDYPTSTSTSTPPPETHFQDRPKTDRCTWRMFF